MGPVSPQPPANRVPTQLPTEGEKVAQRDAQPQQWPSENPLDGWETLRRLPPCRLCGVPPAAGQWVTEHGDHLDCPPKPCCGQSRFTCDCKESP